MVVSIRHVTVFLFIAATCMACGQVKRNFGPSSGAEGGIGQASSCSDQLQNGTETDVDCGGSCEKCLYEKACRANVDCQGNLCQQAVCTPRTRVFSAMGTTEACHDGPNGFEAIPEMTLEFDLDGDYVVLTEFDINVVGCNGCWVGARLEVDGAEDPSWTHVQPQGGPDEDDHIHLFRLDALSAGSHVAQAQWGDGSGTMCNRTGTGEVWVRKITALAIPTSTGVTFGYKHGLTDACTTGPNPYTQIVDMSLDFDLREPNVVLSQFDINWAGSNGAWSAARMVLDGAVDPNWTHSQPQGGADEDDHVHLARIDLAAEGVHSVQAQWGDGNGTMCNSTGQSPQWGRRIGYLAVPVSTGVTFGYQMGSTDACKDAGPYATVPDMSIDLVATAESIALTHFDINWVGSSGSWSAVRLMTDGMPEAHWTHTQPEGGDDEDDHVHLHRMDVVAPGPHTFTAEWGDGGGTMCNNASQSPISRRIGTLLVPVVP